MGGSPGSHGRNWAPAETIDDYLRNCREGLEPYSERRAAKFFGWSRMQMYRVMLVVRIIPNDLFDALIEQRPKVPSWRELAKIARALSGEAVTETECCPHCGAVLRVRSISATSAAIVTKWLSEQPP